MPTPMPSASNSCAREKLASAIFDLASASAPSCGSLEQVGGDAADQRRLARLVLADRGVAGDHVRHLVRQHGGELGVVVGERDQAAGHVELAVGSAKALTAGELRMVTWYFRSGRSDAATSFSTVCVEHGLEPRILVGAAIGGEDALVLALLGWRHFRLLLRQRRRVGCAQPHARARARGERKREQRRQRQPARHRPRCLQPCTGTHTGHASVALRDLDLLGVHCLDPGAAALLDRAAHPNMTACELA